MTFGAPLRIDGSEGEGGGQILRTSLSLSAITGQPFVIEAIRAKRKRPGLLRQHLTAVKAVAEVCGATVEGASPGSSRLSFWPERIRAGSYAFAVGTAGSACLVAQTVLPVLLHAEGPSELVVEGGTHNEHAPSFDFLDAVYLPHLRRMGAEVEATLERYGFYPAGGGMIRLRVAPSTLAPFHLRDAGPVRSICAEAIFAHVPFHVAKRELAVVREALGLPPERCTPREVPSPGPGNALCVRIDRDVPEIVTAFGKRGRRAEEVARDAVAQAEAFLRAEVPVGEHLADQLLLPLALARGGSFRTLAPSLHARTNAAVIERFLGVPVRFSPLDDGSTFVEVG